MFSCTSSFKNIKNLEINKNLTTLKRKETYDY